MRAILQWLCTTARVSRNVVHQLAASKISEDTNRNSRVSIGLAFAYMVRDVGAGIRDALGVVMPHLTARDLDRVTGGNFVSAQDPPLHYDPKAPTGPDLKPTHGQPPGTRYWENSSGEGKSPYQGIEDMWGRATRVMRTFNDTFGWTTSKPGFGR
jgi:hypothetical protein